jgi:dihydrofolate reductase / thymidylate synthase
MELIVAIDKTSGIGYKGKLPWHCPEELKLFKNLTHNSTLVVGFNTGKTLPKLEDRNIICLMCNNTFSIQEISNISKNNLTIIHSLDDLKINDKRIFIAGGSNTYKRALKYKNYVNKVHLSIMKDTYECDTFFDLKWLSNFIITSGVEYEKFFHYKLIRTSNGEQQYLDLLQKIITTGTNFTGRNGITRSLFVEHFVYDIRNGFPLLTTKKMFLRGILEEFLFFIKGETDSTKLSEKNVKIWEGNTSEEFIKSRNLNYAKGVMGPMYGYQWRHFGALYNIDEKGKPKYNKDGIDQLANVLALIKNDPHSRRILLSSYNPTQAEEGVLYPCHSISIQFHVDGEFLDMFCFNRSQDTFLGVPYNIASSSLLLMVVSKLTGKQPRFLKITMGDTHLYENHLEQANIQIKRLPYKFPTLILPEMNNLSDLEHVKSSDFKLENYSCHPGIKADMVV